MTGLSRLLPHVPQARCAEVPGGQDESGRHGAGLWAAVRLLHDALFDGGGRRDGRPAVPSAGSIHPYEILVVTADRGGYGVFEVDGARRRCVRLPSPADGFDAVWAAGLPEPTAGTAHVVVLTRPWLSMRKYGLRGYSYCALDAAHLAVNILGHALSRGVTAELRLHPPRVALRRLLGSALTHREIHSVVTFSAVHVGQPPSGWRMGRDRRERRTQQSLLTELEGLCWDRAPIPSSDRLDEPAQPAPTRLVDPPEHCATAANVLSAWAGLSARRHSSKSFTRDGVPAHAVGRAVAAAGSPLPTDLAGRPRDLRMSVYDLDTAGSDARPEVVTACLGQEYVADAASFVVFHANRTATSCPDRPWASAEVLFRAGAAAQLIYLGAVSLGLGVTAIGGFDPAAWSRLLCLPEQEDVLYVMALGAPGGGAPKIDRLSGPQGLDQ
jgi:nitroreductase